MLFERDRFVVEPEVCEIWYHFIMFMLRYTVLLAMLAITTAIKDTKWKEIKFTVHVRDRRWSKCSWECPPFRSFPFSDRRKCRWWHQRWGWGRWWSARRRRTDRRRCATWTSLPKRIYSYQLLFTSSSNHSKWHYIDQSKVAKGGDKVSEISPKSLGRKLKVFIPIQ